MTHSEERAIELFLDLRRGALSRRDFVTRMLALGATLPIVSAALSACGRSESGAKSSTLMPNGLEPELYVFNWSDYIAEDTVANFEKEFGVKVKYDTYESNEELEAKLLTGGSAYDLCVPTGYTVTRLIAADLLVPLDRSRIKNFANYEKAFLDAPWDKGNVYTAPYQWGMTGISYRSDKLEVPPTDYGIFADSRYRRKMTMMDDGREVIGGMLKWKGESLNCRDTSKLEVAKQDAIVAKKNVKAWISAAVKQQLIAGEVWVAQLWNGDSLQAKAEDAKVEWVLPKEGGNLWSDSLVIPKAGQHPNAAHAFIDYVLRADVGAAISKVTGYGTPNAAAQARLGNAMPYPGEDERKRLEYQIDLGRDQSVWDRLWNEIKTAS